MIDRLVRFVLRPGVSDLAFAALLCVGGLAGAALEPSHGTFWIVAPLFLAVPLLAAGLLLLKSSSATIVLAWVIHALLLLWCGAGAILSLFLVATILAAGLGIILGPTCALLAINSIFSLSRSAYLRRWPSNENSGAA